MTRAVILNPIFAVWAYQQADLCAAAYRHFGFWVAALMLFFCFLGNRIAAAWWKGEA